MRKSINHQDEIGCLYLKRLEGFSCGGISLHIEWGENPENIYINITTRAQLGNDWKIPSKNDKTLYNDDVYIMQKQTKYAN